MTLTIDGVDITPFIKYQGFKWTRSDIDGSDAGRTMDGVMQRNRVATKIRLDISCRPMRTAEASRVLSAIMPQFVTVTYTDPQVGGDVTKVMYSNNNPASYCINKGGYELWHGIDFPLIER